MWADAEVVTLWSEDFSSFSKDAVPSGGTYNYSCGGSNTKIYEEELAGGESPELLLQKNSAGTFTATIPLDNIDGDLTLTFKTNNQKIKVETTTTGLTGGLEEKASGTHTATFKGVTTSTPSITIKFTCTGSSNVRLDDIVLTGTKASGAPTLMASDLALTGAPVALSFDLYNNSSAQVIEYTTSSTGAVTIEDNDYATFVINETNKTITVTPKKKTNGEQEITVSQAADDNYKVGSVTFTLTITDSTPETGTWVLTDLADLTEDDVFVIVGNNGKNYAMSNDKGASDAPKAVEVTVENDEITSVVADNIKWNISGNATDGYTFYPNGDDKTWLYCTNTNNGVRVGTNANSTFIIKDDYLYHGGTSRYVGIYESSDWRCYTTINSNITGQTFAFYKYVDNAAVKKPVITVENTFIGSTTATITCATAGSTIYYSYDNQTWTEYTSALTITETTTIYAKAVLGEDESEVVSKTTTKVLPTPTVTIDATGITNTNVFIGTAAGSLAASVTYNDATLEGAVVTWSGDDDKVATIDASSGAVTLLSAGSVTFTATYAGNSDYAEATATYKMTVTNTDPNVPGTVNNPYTVAQARAAIDAGTGLTNVYATGIVSGIVSAYNPDYGNITYNISADGLSSSDQLQAYRGKSYNGNSFESADDIQIGDVVVIYGNLTKYNSTYEFAQNNQLVSLVRKADPTFSLDPTEATLEAYSHQTVDVTLTTNTDGEITCESNNTDVATVALKSDNVYTITAQAEGTAIITIKSAGSENYRPASAVVVITVQDSRDEAGLSYDVTAFEVELNDNSFVAPTLNNPNSLTVTYSSSNEDVALVDENTGELVLETSAEGTVKITASFAGNENFKSGSASYTITIIDPNSKGMKNNPYTVAEVLDGTATGNGIYVKAFIVGEFVGKTSNPRTSGFNGNTNLAVADEFTTSPTAYNSIPVQLVSAFQWDWGCKTSDGALLGYEVLIKGNIESYFSVKGIKSPTEISAISVPVTINDTYKWATFNSISSLDFTGTDVKAYIVTGVQDDGTLEKTQVYKVPAYTGLLVTGTSARIPATTEDTEDVSANKMDAGEGLEAPVGSYVLSADSNNKAVFKKVGSSYQPIISLNKAYLSVESSSRDIFFIEDGETTGISATLMNNETMNNEYFDLQGRKVANPTKGLYIVNGKKVVIK